MESTELAKSLGVKRVRWLRIASAGALCALLAAAVPVLWLALRAGASLLGLLGISLLLAAGVRALPHLAERLERRLLRARLAAARAEPLEELAAQVLHRSEQVQRYRSALTAIAAQIEGMRRMLDERRTQAGERDLSKQTAALQKMRAFHAHHVQRLAEAERALCAFKQHVEHTRFEWSFVEAGKRALQNLRTTGRDGSLQELLEGEAGRAVQHGFDEVFASLELELLEVQSLPLKAALSGDASR